MVETLTETQDSLRQAIEHIPQGVAVFDRDLRLVTCNTRYGELLALPTDLMRSGTALYDMALF
ncbi:MAG: PAS-domain containing protein, partial [Devosia sp.]|nr:PAS-domain containing protein [Devosia sp.]